jgi:hypothetical protein
MPKGCNRDDDAGVEAERPGDDVGAGVDDVGGVTHQPGFDGGVTRQGQEGSGDQIPAEAPVLEHFPETVPCQAGRPAAGPPREGECAGGQHHQGPYEGQKRAGVDHVDEGEGPRLRDVDDRPCDHRADPEPEVHELEAAGEDEGAQLFLRDHGCEQGVPGRPHRTLAQSHQQEGWDGRRSAVDRHQPQRAGGREEEGDHTDEPRTEPVDERAGHRSCGNADDRTCTDEQTGCPERDVPNVVQVDQQEGHGEPRAHARDEVGTEEHAQRGRNALTLGLGSPRGPPSRGLHPRQVIRWAYPSGWAVRRRTRASTAVGVSFLPSASGAAAGWAGGSVGAAVPPGARPSHGRRRPPLGPSPARWPAIPRSARSPCGRTGGPQPRSPRRSPAAPSLEAS